MSVYGNVYNMLVNMIAQTVVWVIGCFPYKALQEVTSSPNDLSFWTDMDPTDVNNRLLLQQYCGVLTSQLMRIQKHPPRGRTYRESEVH